MAGYAVLTPKVTGDITLNVRVKDCETDEVLLEQSVTQACTKSSNASLEIIPKMKFPSDTWYRVEIQAPNGYNLISRLIRLEFERNGSRPVLDAHLRGFPTPATHLWFGHSTAPNAPQNESYEWCYQEVLMPKEYATINTYLMTLGITGGYMGIQMCGQTVMNENGQYTDTIPSSYQHRVLFSIWDNGDTDITPDLAAHLRAGALANGDDVTINRFGNEGTGCQSMVYNGRWDPGQWVQFLTCARPEERTIVWISISIATFLLIVGAFVLYKRKNATSASTDKTQPPLTKRQFYDKDISEMLTTHLYNNKVLKTADWKLIEERLLQAFPTFRDSLYSLYSLSETEYHICMLIKLEVSPSNMAKLMATGTSTISQSRLRMQQKVFNGQGTAKDWDNYVLSL